MASWSFLANRPHDVGVAYRASWLGEKSGTLYLLRGYDGFVATIEFPLWKWTGSWTPLTAATGLPKNQAEGSPPPGHTIVYNYYWEHVHAFELYDGRFAWAGIKVKETKDTYEIQYEGTFTDFTYEGRPFIRIYDPGSDTWTAEYEYGTWILLESVPAGDYGEQPINPAFVAHHDEDLHFVFGLTNPQYISFDAATNTFSSPISTPLYPAALVSSWPVRYGREWGWLTSLDGVDLHLCCMDANGTNPKVYKLAGGGTSWNLVSITGRVVGIDVLAWKGARHWNNYGSNVATDKLIGDYSDYSPPEYRFFEKTSIAETDIVEPSMEYPAQHGGVNFVATSAGVWCVTCYSVYSYSGADDTTPPTCTITDPEDEDTIAGMYPCVGGCTDDTELATVHLYLSGIWVGQDSVSGTSDTWGITLNTTVWPDGAYTLRACAVDAAGNLGWSAEIDITIDNTGLPPDNEPPVVEITSPADQSEVTGQFSVTADCTDNQALDEAKCYLDGQQQGSAYEFNGAQSGTASWQIDVSDLPNGTYTLSVSAWDETGNIGTDSIQVVINNLQALEPKVLFTESLPLAALRWRLGTDTPLTHMMNVQTGEVPSDAKQRFNVYAGFGTSDTPGATVPADFDEMTLMEVNRAVLLPSDAVAVRWGLKAMPTFRTVHWSGASYEDYFRILTTEDGDVYVVAREPNTVLGFDSGVLTALTDIDTDLGTDVVYEACCLRDKLYIGTDLGMVVFDLDTGQEHLLVTVEPSVPLTKFLAAGSDSVVMAQNGKLFEFTFDETTEIATALTGPVHVLPDGTVVMGTQDASDNGLYRLSGGSWVLIGSTGDEKIRRIWSEQIETAVHTFVGTDESIYRTYPDWQQDYGPAASEGDSFRAFARWKDYWWSGGTGNFAQWYRKSTIWAPYHDEDYVTDIWDLAVINDVLYAACGYDPGSSPQARLIAMVFDEGGTFECGAVPPDVFARILNYAHAEGSE